MGDKLSARAVALAAGVPVVPGTQEPTSDPDVAIAFGDEYGYPVAVKAMFGGGGRGMKVVHSAEQMREALEAAEREAQAAFGRGECYLERYLERPRHVEIQVLADLDGTVIHLGERDCSLQRRHQKLVEEAPAAGITDDLRTRWATPRSRSPVEMGYTNAGTCEFLLDADGESFYFLEMNTRLQVEHPVTELVTGVDLAQAQLRIAAGDGMGITQDEVHLSGHAIEVRINAEEPAANFVPTPGPIGRLTPPLGPWVRFDTGAESDYEVPRDYDSMIGKLIVWASDRDGARARMSPGARRAGDRGHPDHRALPPAGDDEPAVRRGRALDELGRARVGPVRTRAPGAGRRRRRRRGRSVARPHRRGRRSAPGGHGCSASSAGGRSGGRCPRSVGGPAAGRGRGGAAAAPRTWSPRCRARW
jgi:acetyl-CoA/propionyl-CoA carboxylase, biotin carboxylase, biotin carboxyl carrier protein